LNRKPHAAPPARMPIPVNETRMNLSPPAALG
jgi:hypothetical protein